MDAISKFLESRSDARNTYTSEDNLHMTRDGFMIPPPPPGPENLPILGGNIYQGFDPDVEMSVPVQEVPGKNDPSRRLLELMAPAAQLFSDEFGAAFQQYRIRELENLIENKAIEPLDYQIAVIENPTVPLGDYYDAAAGAFFGVPSDDYILHRGQLYPRKVPIDKLTEHHLNNIANNTAVQNADGTLSTVRTITFERNGETYLAPTVFDGKILDDNEAINRALDDGVFVKFATLSEAQEFDNQIHNNNPILGGSMRQISQEEAQNTLANLDLSEDSMLMNVGRYGISALMTDPLGVGTSAIAPAARLVRSAMGDTTDSNVLASGIVPSGVPSTEAADVSDIGFYSAVNRAVEALPMEKGSASQMRSMIAKAEGVKPEEMAWIGLDDFLKGKKSVTKAEVQDYVQANQVQLEEVTKRGDLPQRTADEWQDLIDNAEAQGDYDAADALTRQWEAAEGLGGTAYPDSPKFASYTLPGGANYREVLLTLPDTRAYTAADGARYLELQRKDFDGKLNDPDEVAEFYRLADAAKEARKNKFRGGHFEEDNVLAHMRLNDRTGPDGERILFIEEIQSDWHQKGRKAGYKTPEDTAAIAQINGRLDKLLDQEMEINGDLFDNYGLGGTALPDGKGVRFYSRDIIENNDYKNIGRVYANGSFYVDEAFGAANPAIADRIKELSEISAERAQLKQQRSEITRPSRELARVPDAPMKKTWHEMSFRRVARMAAEEGYDAIAWTPGKMQAERYDLSRKIDALEYTPLENGQYKIEITDSDLAEVTLPNDGIFDASGLANFVGQEIADKIVRGEGKKLLGVERASDFRYSLTGVDLEVGGEGMKGFYDKMLKNYAAKWGKKFGAKVGVTDIENSNIKDVETKVWTLPVTKKMRDSIMQKGVPLFAAGGAAVMSQVEGERNGN